MIEVVKSTDPDSSQFRAPVVVWIKNSKDNSQDWQAGIPSLKGQINRQIDAAFCGAESRPAVAKLITHMAIMHISNNAWLLAGTIVVPGIICVIRVLWRCGSEHFCLDSPLACLKKNLLARSVKNLPPSSQEVARGVTQRDAIAFVV
ncbi:hypothetical protein EDB87DRAFT_1820470 [Lactarius vividus]|nr:hypothetical protein EDB87DRAFT_1820470 [Lactarius vividus]